MLDANVHMQQGGKLQADKSDQSREQNRELIFLLTQEKCEKIHAWVYLWGFGVQTTINESLHVIKAQQCIKIDQKSMETPPL